MVVVTTSFEIWKVHPLPHYQYVCLISMPCEYFKAMYFVPSWSFQKNYQNIAKVLVMIVLCNGINHFLWNIAMSDVHSNIKTPFYRYTKFRYIDKFHSLTFTIGIPIPERSLYWSRPLASKRRRLSSPHNVVNGHMMTSSNGNIFRVTGHLCGEFTGPRWIPRTKASDAELWCFLWSASE